MRLFRVFRGNNIEFLALVRLTRKAALVLLLSVSRTLLRARDGVSTLLVIAPLQRRCRALI